jgi:thermitase
MHRALKAGLLVAALALVPSTAFAAEYDAHTVIAQFAPGADSSALARSAGALQRIGTVAVNGAQVLRTTTDSATVAKRLNALPGVVYAEPDFILSATAIPNDPRFGELYGIHNTGQSGGRADADLDGPEGWDLAALGGFPASGGAKVGIVDTGIDKTHPDLAGKLANCAGASQGVGGIIGGGTVSESNTCVDDNDHGTHVSGTISGNANNGIGVAGVAFNSPLAMCKALFGPLGSGNTTGVANCITYLAGKGVKVISMSLGGGASTTLQNAVRSAYNNGNGALLVAAAGNDGDATLNYPAAYAEVVSVAATDRNDARASFSNANADVEVAAAGVDVLSTVRGGSYATMSGTSMATPHVAGVAGLIATKNPTFTAAQIRSKLDSSVDDLGAAGRDANFGFGRVTLTKALS